MQKKSPALSLTLGSLFVACTAIGANITSIAPFMIIGGVPITLQTFFAVLAGLMLGSRTGALSMFVYMMLGLAGAPVFAQFKSGPAMILHPLFGFILSFILVAYVAGKIAERSDGVKMYVTASLVGMAINYVIGTNWMYAAYALWVSTPSDFSYKLMWMWMAVPLPKDIALSVLAGLFAFRLNKQGISMKQVQKKYIS